MSSKKITKLKVTYDKEYFEYQTNRGWIRERIRQIYLYHYKYYLKGLTIDFGCGAGGLLKLLSLGSLGLEVNPVAVKNCIKNNLNVELYLPEKDNYTFKNIKKDVYENFSMCHVLEHIEDTGIVLRKIFNACQRMGIEKIVIVVPGHKGFLSDRTHRTFINLGYLESHNLTELFGFKLCHVEYFPINIKIAGNWLTHNESIFIYERTR